MGFAWTPHFENGLLAAIFGKGDETVIRGGWDITYFDEGTNMFASTAGSNTGQSQALVASAGTQFAPGSMTLQSPLPPFQASPATYQESWNQSEIAFVNGLGSMFSDLETGYVKAWNIGLQRLVAKDTVIEVRYLGNRAEKLWHSFSLNEVNIFENGFLDEFKNARANLAINEAAGSTGFSNQGRPGQIALPIFDAAFGARGAAAVLPALRRTPTPRSFRICEMARRAGSPDALRPIRRTSAAWSGARSVPASARAATSPRRARMR